MSLGEADAKFPDSGASGLPPSPSKENPGQVFPKTDPSPAPQREEPKAGNTSYTGNLSSIRPRLQKLGGAIGDVIQLLEKEEQAAGGSVRENEFLQRLKSWKLEVERESLTQTGHCGYMRQLGDDIPPERDGGLFTD